ncbi:MAG TPA: hypothetical protein VG710_04285 [Opitutus sp.]|nr:hypothetical protein [Opitutus sp.]
MIILAAGLGLAGFWLLFTGFKTYDDEGYVLVSLANFARSGRLYTDIFSQYGPFFYWWNDALQHLLHFEFTNTTGRIVTLVYWVAAALFCAWIVDRQTRVPGWALLALAATFAHLWQMTAEPMHPGGWIAFVVALAAWAGAECIVRGRARGLALVVGLCGAALALTKINVGLFLFAGGGMWLALNADESLPVVWRKIAALGLVAMPWALMYSLLGQEWVLTFATIVSTSIIGAMIAMLPTVTPLVRKSDWFWLAGSTAAVAVVISALTLARGTDLHELLEGILLGPLRHPGVYSFAVNWRPGATAWAIVSCALCAIAHVLGWNTRPGFIGVVVVARIVLLVAAVLGWFARLPVSSLALCLSYGLPAVWLLVIPLTHDGKSFERARVRSWLGLVLLTQSLHAYPIGGSQIGWGTFLWVPLLMLAAAEAREVLSPRWLRRTVSPLAIVAAFALAFAFAREGWRRWRTSEPLELAGAETLRLPEALTAHLRTVALNARVHAGELFSLPGLFSFNLWTGRPTPTAENVTHWFSLLGADEQQQIIRRLQADPRAMIVVERSLLQFMRSAGLNVGGPLYDYLKRDFTPAFGAGDYAVWCRRGRAIAPLSSARLYERKDLPGSFQLDICVLSAPGSQVARIDWMDCSDENYPRLRVRFDAANSTLQIASLRSDGQPFSPTIGERYPAELPRLARIELITQQPLGQLPQRDAVLRLYDPTGAIIAEVVFVD